MSTIGQAVASNAGLKFATGGLAAALALGGGAMATSQLTCECPAPEAIGHLLVATGLRGNAAAGVETRRIEVEGLGQVDVAHSDSGVEVVDVQPNEGASAEVRSQSETSAEIDFVLDGVTRTLLVMVTDGQLVASLASSASAADSTSIDAAVGAEGDTSIEADGESDGEVGLLGGLGIEIDLGG